jgi:hypothetical protein
VVQAVMLTVVLLAAPLLSLVQMPVIQPHHVLFLPTLCLSVAVAKR